MYKEELLTKPAVLVLNKIDLPDSAALVDDIMNKVTSLKGAFTPLNRSNMYVY
jgi:GTPase SAR1 family protein